jgi:mRNA interferase RelE/StbE
MKFEIFWDEGALKDLEKLELLLRKRIVRKIEALAENFTFHEIKKLQNTEGYRMRVGDYRVIFLLRSDRLIVLKVIHRKNIYKNF